MSPSNKVSTSTCLLLVGLWPESHCLCNQEKCVCTSCGNDLSGFSLALKKQVDANVVIVLSADFELTEAWLEALQKSKGTVAILGLSCAEPSSVLADLCDSLIKVDQLEMISVVCPPLAKLAAVRRELFKREDELGHETRLIDQVSMAIIGTDLSGQIKAWNHRAEGMFGFSSAEVVGQPLNRIFQQNSGNEFSMQKLLEPLLIHDRHQFETDIRRRDGVLLPIHASLSLEKNIKGDIIGVICCCRDISLRRRVEEEKRDAFQRLTFFLERMPLGFIEWGADFSIRAWNQSAEEIFGYSQKEAIGQPFTLLIKDDMIEDCRRIFRSMENHRAGNRNRNENLTRDQRVIICDWNNTALLDENNEVIGYASIVEDVTERIAIEEELKQSREAAHTANRSKDEFLAVMSHEVRTPMNSIIGFADLLMESLKDDEEAELVNIIKANAFNLLELISNVLNYSRLEAGQVVLREQETDLLALMHEVKEVTNAEAKEKNLTFDAEILPDTPRHIFADYSELRQVLLNLSANALKFTNTGAISISISAKRIAGGKLAEWELLFAVKDTGIGIEDADQDKLFQSFTQLDSSSTRRFGGTGLGLAICRRIVELWKGKIWAESNRGEGSTFYFTLPTQENAAEIEEYDSPVYDEIEDERFAEIYPMKLMLLTSTVAAGEVLEHITVNLGYEIAIEHEAIDAISHLQDKAYDVVLIDDDLKDFSAKEMIEIIAGGQAGQANRNAQIVLLSEHGPHEDTNAASMANVVTVSKPIIARSIRQVLRKTAIDRDNARADGR